MDERKRWLATALLRIETLISRLRERTAIDEDWLDDVRERACELLRDLAEDAAIASRADGDPLVVVRAAPPFRTVDAKEIGAGAGDERIALLLADLARLRTKSENARLADRIEETLAR